MGRRKIVLTDELVNGLEVVAYMLDLEADNLEQNAPDLRATDISQQSADAGGRATVSQILHGIATWIRKLIPS